MKLMQGFTFSILKRYDTLPNFTIQDLADRCHFFTVNFTVLFYHSVHMVQSLNSHYNLIKLIIKNIIFINYEADLRKGKTPFEKTNRYRTKRQNNGREKSNCRHTKRHHWKRRKIKVWNGVFLHVIFFSFVFFSEISSLRLSGFVFWSFHMSLFSVFVFSHDVFLCGVFTQRKD